MTPLSFGSIISHQQIRAPVTPVDQSTPAPAGTAADPAPRHPLPPRIESLTMNKDSLRRRCACSAHTFPQVGALLPSSPPPPETLPLPFRLFVQLRGNSTAGCRLP